MSRRSDQLDRIESAVARLEGALARHASVLREHGDHLAAARADASSARSAAQAAQESAQAAHAGVQALADMQAETLVPADPPLGAGTSQAAGGGAEGEPVTAARRAPKTLKPPRERM